MYRLNQIKLNIYHNEDELRKKIAKVVDVGVDDIDWTTLIILHKSIDARDKKNILFVYNVAFDFVSDSEGVNGIKEVSDGVGADIIRPKTKISFKHQKLEKYEPIVFNPIIKNVKGKYKSDIVNTLLDKESIVSSNINVDVNKVVRPIVIGFGPAGIFASFILALNGLKPIIIERGKKLEDRTEDVKVFFETMELDEESNVCFGEGGAGAFSDGKLNTNNKDKTGVYKFVLETFVKFGADKKILYENMPHIGTDKLVDVIKNIREEILKLGGEIHYNTKFCIKDGLMKFISEDSDVTSIILGGDKHKIYGSGDNDITTDMPVILAIGNSSRDTFRDLIENGFDVKAKPIAVGYRIAHKQSFINEAQYSITKKVKDTDKHIVYDEKKKSVDKILGPATYKLTYDVGNGHSVYSFCMCPGGYIINSSNKKGMLSINGMSYNDRSGKYANSAIVETIGLNDVLGISHNITNNVNSLNEGSKEEQIKECSPLQMIEFQEQVERKAFELEKGFIPYVASFGSDICKDDLFKGQAKYCEKLKSVYEECGLKIDINKDIEEALKHFNKIIPGFFEGNLENNSYESKNDIEKDGKQQYVIAGVETRTSSPVKLDRDENYMCNVKNFYPCGEGLGHGGGIMSCAVDGINVAIKVVKRICSV